VAGWTTLFHNAGFAQEAVVHYDFNPCMRTLAAVRQRAGRGHSPGVADRVDPDSYMARDDRAQSRLSNVAKQTYWGLMRVAGAADRRIDPLLARRTCAFPRPVHAGMTFVRT